MTCPSCERALTDWAFGETRLGCHACYVRRVAQMQPIHRSLEFDAIENHDKREALKVEVRAEYARQRALREMAHGR